MAKKLTINALGYDLGVALETDGTMTIVVVAEDAVENDVVTYLNADFDRMQQWVDLIQEYINVGRKGGQ